jgi:hypothetical protein
MHHAKPHKGIVALEKAWHNGRLPLTNQPKRKNLMNIDDSTLEPDQEPIGTAEEDFDLLGDLEEVLRARGWVPAVVKAAKPKIKRGANSKLDEPVNLYIVPDPEPVEVMEVWLTVTCKCGCTSKYLSQRLAGYKLRSGEQFKPITEWQEKHSHLPVRAMINEHRVENCPFCRGEISE